MHGGKHASTVVWLNNRGFSIKEDWVGLLDQARTKYGTQLCILKQQRSIYEPFICTKDILARLQTGTLFIHLTLPDNPDSCSSEDFLVLTQPPSKHPHPSAFRILILKERSQSL